MARIFLDTNYFIDAIIRKSEKVRLETLIGNNLFISALSVHIYCYIYKIKIPDIKITEQVDKFHVVEFSEEILARALVGPTDDFEDNVQLYSSVKAECDIFLTLDKKLLKMKFYGKAKIMDSF